jgi:NADH-quinone oxidoreductase subunit J
LVVFGVMLTAQGPFINLRVGAAEWAIALGVGLLLYGVLAVCLVEMPPPTAAEAQLPSGELPSSVFLGAALLGDTSATPQANVTGVPGTGWGPGAVAGAADVAHGGRSKFALAPTRARAKVAYLLPFEIVSVHLLVVLIAAAYLARAKRRRQPAPGASA